MLMLACEVDDLVHLARRHFARVRAANPHALAVNLQHDLRRFFPTHAEHSLEHDHDKVHRRVIVVQQDDLVQRWRLYPGPFRLEHASVLLLVGHRVSRKPNWGPCLMLATIFSSGKPMDGIFAQRAPSPSLGKVSNRLCCCRRFAVLPRNIYIPRACFCPETAVARAKVSAGAPAPNSRLSARRE